MTENEAIKDIKRQLLEIDSEDADITLSTESLKMAIQALEDMQKLKELGECYVIPKKGTFEINGIDVHTEIEELEQYRAIGTVERFEQLSKQFAPHNVDETSCHLRQCNKCDMYRKENEKYHEIGTIDEFKALKEKNEPKKVAYQGEHEKCPSCGSFHVFGKHCTECGQAVDYD